MNSNRCSGARWSIGILALAMAIMVMPAVAGAQAPAAPPPGQAPPAGGPPPGANNMKAPYAPFHIIGNIYYIGSKGLACYLITTPAGNILLDTGYPDMAPQIEGNIQTLGFNHTDTKILPKSRAHIDRK